MYEVALLLSVACLLGVGFFFARNPAFSVFHPLTIYIAFHGLIFVFRPILAYFLNYRYIYSAFRFTPSASDKLTVIFASNLGFLVFAFFCMRAGAVALRFKQDVFVTAERRQLKRLFPWVLAICVPIGGYSLFSLWFIASGVSSDGMISDSSTGIAINTTGIGYMREAQLMLATSGAILAWIFRFRLVACLPLLLFAVTRAGTGGRWPVVVAIVAAGLLYLYDKKRKLPGPMLVFGSVALLAAFSAVGTDRGRAIREMTSSNQTRERQYSNGGTEKFMEGMDYGNLEYFEYLVYVVPQRSHTYDFFLNNIQLFTEPIPRVLWKDKPIGAPVTRFSLFEYGDPVGMTRSLPGEGWFAFGWFGVVIWCGLWGQTLGWIYRKFAQSSQETLQTAAYMIFLASLIAAFRDGVLITVFRYNLFFLAPVALWFIIARMRGIATAQMLRNTAYRHWRKRNPVRMGPDATPAADLVDCATRRSERSARRGAAGSRQPRFRP